MRLAVRGADAWASQMSAMDAERLFGSRTVTAVNGRSGGYSDVSGRSAFMADPASIEHIRSVLRDLVREDKEESSSLSRHTIALTASKLVWTESQDPTWVATVLENYHLGSGPGPDPTGPSGDVGQTGRPFHLDTDAVIDDIDALLRSSSDGGNTGFFDSQMGIDPRGEATGFTQASSSTTFHPATRGSNPGHLMPGLQLPRRNKTAFSSAELFEQQSNMQRHDHGLQSVLVALHVAVSQMIEETVPLGAFDFTMNFAQAASVTTKRYSVRMRHPIVEQLDLVQRMDAGTMTVRWTVVRNGTEIFFDPHQPVEMGFQAGPQPGGREQRVITLDDEGDDE